MFCPNCGKELSDLATACPQCGHPLSPKPSHAGPKYDKVIAETFGQIEYPAPDRRLLKGMRLSMNQ